MPNTFTMKRKSHVLKIPILVTIYDVAVTSPVAPKFKQVQTMLHVLRTQHDRHIITTDGKIDIMPLHVYKVIWKCYYVKYLKCSAFEMATYDDTYMANLEETTLYTRHYRINH